MDLKKVLSVIKGKSRPTELDNNHIDLRTSDPAFKKIDKSILKNVANKDIEDVKRDITKYLSSELYKKRQANFPEQTYDLPDFPMNDNYKKMVEMYDKSFANSISNTKRTGRILNMLGTKANIKNIGLFSDSYQGDKNEININKLGTNAVIAHELTHSMFNPSNSDSSDNSDYHNSMYYRGKRDRPDVFLNKGEQSYLNELVKSDNKASSYDEHYAGKNTIKGYAANESYSDIMALRQLFKDNGITKNFGDNITNDDFNKALKIKNIANDPNFKRIRLKYKDEHIPVLNNIIAIRNNTNNNYNV